MDGLIILDKPRGPSCAQIDSWIREKLGKKVAHIGTLDPPVSGVLPILVGKAVRLSHYLQKHDKEYVCLMKVDGVEDFEPILKQFVGKIYQRPPKEAAVKKVIRVRKIYSIEVLEKKQVGNKTYALLKIHCQHGTYIRKLIEDIGLLMGRDTEMVELRRIKCGPFDEREGVILQRFFREPEKYILPLEEAVRGMGKIFLKESAAMNVIKGAPLYGPGVEKMEGHIVKNGPVAMFYKDTLLAIGISQYNKGEFPKRGPVVRTKTVLRDKTFLNKTSQKI